MKTVHQLPFLVLFTIGIVVFAIGCDGDEEETATPYTPVGRLSLSTNLLDFGESLNELTFAAINVGDTVMSWEVSTVPDWADLNPSSGFILSSDTTEITVSIQRSGFDPGVISHTLSFATPAPEDDDTLMLKVTRNCDLLSDNFSSGNAAGWEATGLTTSQENGYVILDPDSPGNAGRLMQQFTPPMPSVVSSRLQHTAQDAAMKQYGILLENAAGDNALYYAVYVDNDTNYTFEQRIEGDSIVVLHAGYTGLLNTGSGNWNILRLELYQEGPTVFARGYAGTEDLPLFEGVALDDGTFDFVKMGIRSDEYTIYADWFCVTGQ